MFTVVNQYGVAIPWRVAVSNMDYEIASITSKDSFDGESPQSFFERYCDNYLDYYHEETEMNSKHPQL